MAYGDNTYGADHRWPMESNGDDVIGTLNLALTNIDFTSAHFIRDKTASMRTNNRDDLARVGTDSTTGDTTTLDRYSIQGWFKVTDIQGPPCLVYKQGGGIGFGIFIWGGNTLTAQCKLTAKTIQIYSDISLTSGRWYHLMITFQGNAFDNEFAFYIDGKKQENNNGDVTIGQQYMDQHSGNFCFGENGNTGTDMDTGDNTVLTKACINGLYNEWWTWSGANAVFSETEIFDNLFVPGAPADVVITSDTEANMQTQLDSIASSIRPDVPLAILVEEVLGGGDLNLTADNITFNSRCSCHVQYEGSGTLFWTNANGSDASISSGNVTFLNPSVLTLTNLAENTEVRVYAAGTQNEIAGEENVTGGLFSATISTSPIDIRLYSLNYLNQTLLNLNISSDTTIKIDQFVDPQYENP